MTSIKMPYGMDTPEDQLQMTTDRVEDYLSGEQLYADKAQIAAQQMHSMQDWTIRHRLTDFGCKNGGDFRNKIYAAEPRLTVIRDFANATKHGGCLKNSNRVLEKVEIAGDYSRAFSPLDFDTVRMELHLIPGAMPHTVEHHLRNGNYLEMDEVIKDCLEFWTTLYETRQIPPYNHSEWQKAGAVSETHRRRIQLPDEIGSTTNQLTIAEKMVDQSSRERTPAASYLAATAIVPLEHWGYEDLRMPMEFPTKKDFRQYLYEDCPSIKVTRELARAAKGGAKVIGNAGRMVIVLKDRILGDSAETFSKAIAFWQEILAEYAGYRRK